MVFNIPSSCQNQGPSKIVCVNPSALLNCIAGVLCETDPREFVPQFVKAGKVEKFWPTGARPNEWTLRAAIADIVSKGFVRESVVPLCFQVRVPLDLHVLTMLSVASIVCIFCCLFGSNHAVMMVILCIIFLLLFLSIHGFPGKGILVWF